MAMFSSKMDVNSFEIGNQTYRSMNPMFSKIKKLTVYYTVRSAIIYIKEGRTVGFKKKRELSEKVQVLLNFYNLKRPFRI
jgi:hypothetical protein